MSDLPERGRVKTADQNIPQWWELTEQQQEAITRTIESRVAQLAGKDRAELLNRHTDYELPEQIYSDYTHGRESLNYWSQWFGNANRLAADLDSGLAAPAANALRPADPFENIITDGSHMVNGKLKPNCTYKTSKNGYIYRTNERGLIEYARADDLKEKDHDGRFKHDSNTPGKREGDHAGHLFGDRFEGSPKLDNLVTQAKHVNLSEYKKLENQWARAIKNNQKVSVEIKINYDAQGDGRPVSFKIKYTIDGDCFSTTIEQ